MNNIEFTNSELLDDSIINESSSSYCGADGYMSSYKRNRFSPSRTIREKSLMEIESNFTNESLLDGLSDVSLLNADGEPEFSNAISPEQVDAAAKAAGIAANIIRQRRAAKAESEKGAIKASCGRKPIFGKAKKAKYQKCVSDFLKNKQDAEKTKPQVPDSTFVPTNIEKMAAPEEDDKFLGMPKAVGITVTVVGALALIVGGIFLVKKLRK
jgi:hypothetical protein